MWEVGHPQLGLWQESLFEQVHIMIFLFKESVGRRSKVTTLYPLWLCFSSNCIFSKKEETQKIQEYYLWHIWWNYHKFSTVSDMWPGKYKYSDATLFPPSYMEYSFFLICWAVPISIFFFFVGLWLSPHPITLLYILIPAQPRDLRGKTKSLIYIYFCNGTWEAFKSSKISKLILFNLEGESSFGIRGGMYETENKNWDNFVIWYLSS